MRGKYTGRISPVNRQIRGGDPENEESPLKWLELLKETADNPAYAYYVMHNMRRKMYGNLR
jgi:hypothetical protein